MKQINGWRSSVRASEEILQAMMSYVNLKTSNYSLRKRDLWVSDEVQTSFRVSDLGLFSITTRLISKPSHMLRVSLLPTSLRPPPPPGPFILSYGSLHNYTFATELGLISWRVLGLHITISSAARYIFICTRSDHSTSLLSHSCSSALQYVPFS